ncbi:MAG: ROK family protein [Actinobacteria bacterium]|nr:ROK family protein [Actinomycetota bacterium]MBU1493917.1 ROK family protein [Actinomycetota bacterium]
MQCLGVDFGGTGIKGAVVDLVAGELAADRHRLPTPQPSTPEEVAATIAAVVAEVTGERPCEGPVGIAVPAVVTDGIVKSAANIDPSWVGCDGRALLSDVLGREVLLLNDADAAGVAEMRYGAGSGRHGTTLLLTLGTGIGSALFIGERLVPNTELGHLVMWGSDAEAEASAKAREVRGLEWQEWVETRLNPYLAYLESLLWPDLIIISGGVSKNPERFFPYLRGRAEVVPAQLENNAGIVGAALAAQEALG